MNHNLIPITKLKMNKEKWLNTPIKYEDDFFVKDVLEQMSQKTYEWILSNYNPFFIYKLLINIIYEFNFIYILD